jgi:hypothetical protein
MADSAPFPKPYLVLAVLLVLLQVLTPITQAASVLESSAARPATLGRLPGEMRTAYLERVARTQPERFQAAVLAALQDALNGTAPNLIEADAFETLVETYLSQPIAQSRARPAPPPPPGPGGPPPPRRDPLPRGHRQDLRLLTRLQ